MDKINNWAQNITDAILSEKHFDRESIVSLMKSNLRLAMTDILSDRSEIEFQIIELKKSLDNITDDKIRVEILDTIRLLKSQKNDAKRTDKYSKMCRVIYKKFGSNILTEIKNEMK